MHQVRQWVGTVPRRPAAAPEPASLLETSSAAGRHHPSPPINLAAINLPKKFDWRNVNGVSYVDEVVSQICGACYAVSTTSQINCRARVATNNTYKAQFNYKQILHCDRNNQGCAGGYPYMSLRYAMEFGMVESGMDDFNPNQCPQGVAPHNTEGVPHKREAGSTPGKPVVRVSDYGYIGGYYGATTAQGLLSDVYHRGPVSVGIGGKLELLHYKSGVYKPTKTKHSLYDFEPVTHAVLVVGWETAEDGTIHYIVKNSYGADWGESGYFRTSEFLAGKDSEDVESLSASGLIKPFGPLLAGGKGPGGAAGAAGGAKTSFDDVATQAALSAHKVGRKGGGGGGVMDMASTK